MCLNSDTAENLRKYSIDCMVIKTKAEFATNNGCPNVYRITKELPRNCKPFDVPVKDVKDSLLINDVEKLERGKEHFNTILIRKISPASPVEEMKSQQNMRIFLQ